MNIHEYQARQLLRDHGIPVQPENLSCPASNEPKAAIKSRKYVDLTNLFTNTDGEVFFSLQDWSIYVLI